MVDVVVDGVDIAPQACLLDSGATRIRFGTHVADICGLDLEGAPEHDVSVGGATLRARMAEVTLGIGDGSSEYEWQAPAWFCDPWPASFGLLGLTGFFDHFEVLIAAYQERLELEPIN